MKTRTLNTFVCSHGLTMLAGGGVAISGSAFAADELQVLSPATRQHIQIQPAGPLGLVTRSLAVPMKDLDLAVQADVDTLYSRLTSAARDVCDRMERHDILLRRGFNQCVGRSLGNAVADIGNPAVSARHVAVIYGAPNPDSSVASAH